MPVKTECRERAMRAYLSGEVDHHGAREIMGVLDREIGQALPGSLELDLSGVSFMDSSGIAVVIRAWRRMGELGGTMRLRSVPHQARRVLETAGLHKLIPFE